MNVVPGRGQVTMVKRVGWWSSGGEWWWSGGGWRRDRDGEGDDGEEGRVVEGWRRGGVVVEGWWRGGV